MKFTYLSDARDAKTKDVLAERKKATNKNKAKHTNKAKRNNKATHKNKASF